MEPISSTSAPLLGSFALSCLIISSRMYIIGALTAFHRRQRNEVIVPEDAIFLSKDEDKPLMSGEVISDRFSNIHRNDMESVLPWFMMACNFILAALKSSNLSVHQYFGIGFFVVFAIQRIVYSIIYAFGLQPWRSITYHIGFICTIIMMVYTVIIHFTIDSGTFSANVLRIIFLFSCVILVIKMYVVGFLTAFYRMRSGRDIVPEDSMFTKKLKKIDVEVDLDQKYSEIHKNDIDSILPWFIAALIFVLGYIHVKEEYIVASITGSLLMATFMLSRIFYTIYNIYSLPRRKNIALTVGNLCLIVTAFWGIVSLISSDI